jgi:hypothetical protein
MKNRLVPDLQSFKIMPENGIPALVLCILVLLSGGGCISVLPGGGAGVPRQVSPPGAVAIASPQPFSASNPPSVYITSPEFDGGIDAGNVTVNVLVRNFSLVHDPGRTLAAGIGHIICFMDVPPRTGPGVAAKTLPGTFQISYQTSCTWYNVSPGTHTFPVELVNDDNTPLEPPVIDAVDVTAVAHTG